MRSRPSPSTNGSSPPDRFDLEPPSRGSARSKWPEVTVGLLVVALFALVGTWFYSSTSDRDPVLAVRNPIERGQVITANDLVIVNVASEQTVSALPSDQSGLVIGRTALVDLSPGTLATADLFAEQAAIEPGHGVVGLALDPGEYPTLTLRPGDMVRIVNTPKTSDAAAEIVLVEAAEVIDVAPIGVQNQLFVSVSMSATQADAVSIAASQDRVRLVQVAGS